VPRLSMTSLLIGGAYKDEADKFAKTVDDKSLIGGTCKDEADNVPRLSMTSLSTVDSKFVN